MAHNYKRGEFCNFLARYKVEKGSEFTHTSIFKPSGSFYVPVSELDIFYDMYQKALLGGEDLYMTEKHRDISPFLIDLDFRFERENVLRKYTRDDITKVIQVYLEKCSEYLTLDAISPVVVFLLEKPQPTIDKGLTKDGVHIIIPDIVTKPSVQYIIRKQILQSIKEKLEPLGCLNTVDDIVDEAVIERNNWQMYGSKKPNSMAYTVTCKYIYDCETRSLNQVEDYIPNHKDLVEILSIRNKYEATPIKIEKETEVKEFEKIALEKKKAKMQSTTSNMLQTSYNTRRNETTNLEHIQKLVDILNPNRAETYHGWIQVGWCLRNIDHRLLDTWIEFSKKSSKFVDGECEKMWRFMRDDGLGIGTLYMWAKQDNPEAYKEIMQNDIHVLIYNSRNDTHFDIANVVHFMFKHEFICASITHNAWYQFSDHRWKECEKGTALTKKLSMDVWKQYSSAASLYHAKAASSENENEQIRFSEDGKKLAAIATKLKNGPFKRNIMDECKHLFYVEKFQEKLDSKCHLIGFENGVYDLVAQEFREGHPEDYISFSTGCNYIPYDPRSIVSLQVDTFLSQVLNKPHIKEYVLLLLSSFLNGNIREEKFHIWTGSGSNGKSVLIDLFEQAFGDYCCKFPVTLLTQKRAASGAANPELAGSKGKRFAVLQEPSENERLNVGLMKELSGGDKIQARALYSDCIEFKPQFKMVLTCNHLPNVPSDDGGTWRRIRLVEFTSRFTHSPDPNIQTEFPIDVDLSAKFPDWREHFISLLIEYYKKYIKEGITEPEEVLKCTRDYQRTNDYYMEFVETELEKHNGPNTFLTSNDAWSLFKSWAKDNVPNLRLPKKGDMIKAFDKICGKSITVNRVVGWKGYKVKPYECNDLISDAHDDLG